jgi:hypothetical protein
VDCILSKMNQYNHININININNDLQQIPLQSYSTLGPLLTNDISENIDFTDMPDLVSDPLVPLEPALASEPILDFINDSEVTDDLDPVFICEYQANALESKKSLDEIKRNIEKTVNFNNVSESMAALNNPDILINRIQQAFDSFKSQVGRPMTYLEMREMMG